MSEVKELIILCTLVIVSFQFILSIIIVFIMEKLSTKEKISIVVKDDLTPLEGFKVTCVGNPVKEDPNG